MTQELRGRALEAFSRLQVEREQRSLFEQAEAHFEKALRLCRR